MEDRLSKVVAQLQALPPGSLVPREWVLSLVADPDEANAPSAAPPSTVDLTVEALADMFGRRPSTVRSWIERGDFPGSYKLHGKQWRVPTDAVDAFQQTQRAARCGSGLAAWRRKSTPND